MKLDAAASSDPDGHPLRFEWFHYPEPGTYRGPVQLIGSGKKALHPGVGVDSLQALINAIRIAQIELESLEHETGGEVHWLDQRGLGLPQI